MKDVTLEEVALAGGEGVRLLQRSLREAGSVPSRIEMPRRPTMKTWSTTHPIRER